MNNLSSISVLNGNTPLVKISRGVYGKLETYNCTGSVKDRMVQYVVSSAIDDNLINESTVLCEATSGNTGISLSSVAALLGLKCRIYMPANMSKERTDMMKVFGSEVIYSDPDDFAGAIEMRDDFLKSNSNSWSPLQFSNPKNIECHTKITAPEIHNDMMSIEKSWDAFIHGSGTGGTIEGVRRYIIQEELSTSVHMVKPAESPHGIQGIADGKDFLADPNNMDSVLEVSTVDAISRAKNFVKSTGILVGISSGANILAAESWARENDGNVVTMLCDRGERYMSVFGDKSVHI